MNNSVIVNPASHNYDPQAIDKAIALWAEARTDQTITRHDDLIHDKSKAVGQFFAFSAKHPMQVSGADVEAWQHDLQERKLSPTTIYAMVSRVSSFYRWCAENAPGMAGIANPVDVARPRAPKPYQNKLTKALDDDQARALVQHIRKLAEAGNITAKRDYVMLRMFLVTGMRREEVVSLRWGDVKTEGGIVKLSGKVKGGDIITREVKDQAVKVALLDYLQSSGRMETMQADSPLWVGHANRDTHGKPMSSRSFADNLKRYALQAGIGDVHVHMTRYTFARIVAEESGSLVASQDALGHRNAATTKVYVQRLGTKKDVFSGAVAARLEE